MVKVEDAVDGEDFGLVAAELKEVHAAVFLRDRTILGQGHSEQLSQIDAIHNVVSNNGDTTA